MRVISEASDTEYTKQPICPFCGEEIDTSDNYELYDLTEDEEQEFECGHCLKKFTIQMHISYSWTTKRPACADDKHQYVLSEDKSTNPYIYDNRNWTIYKCSICHDELIKTGPVAEDGKPYVVPLYGGSDEIH